MWEHQINLLGAKGNCHGISGYFSNYIPEEIIAATGLYPLRMIGFNDTQKASRSVMFNPICSFVQDVFTAAGSGEYSFLTNIIFPNSCDSLRVLGQMWEHQIKTPKAYTLFHPINVGGIAVDYFAREIKRFSEQLQQDTGVNFTDDVLKSNIDKYNQTRILLRELYEIRKTNDRFLKGSDAVALMTAGLIMDRDEYNLILSQIVKEGKKTKLERTNSKRVMVAGPLVDNYAILSKIEDTGTYIACDDITNGSRYFDLDVETEGDLYVSLAKRYLLSGPSPTLNSDNPNTESLKRLIREFDVHSVIYINQKFCEPHVHNYLAVADILKQMGKNFLMLEVEHDGPTVSQRDLLRIESLLELAGRS